MTRPVRIGISGAGRIGRLHAENLAFRIPGAEVIALADVVEEAAARCAERCKVPTVRDDPRRLFEDPAIDAVVIASSTDTHASQIIAAAEHGKHIFCEKPIALDLAEIDRALEAVERAGVILQIGFNRRFDPGFRRARDLVQSGALGIPHVVRITSRDPSPPPAEYVAVSGGMFKDMTIHDFDMARWIIGEEVEELFVMAGVLVDPAIGAAGDVDTAVISLRYASGALGAIDNSRKAAYGYDQRLEIFGSEGSVVVGNETPTRAVVSRADGVVGDTPLHFFMERYTASYVAELTEFVDCLRTGRAPSVTGIDGRIPVVMAMAAKASLDQGRPVTIELPTGGGDIAD